MSETIDISFIKTDRLTAGKVAKYRDSDMLIVIAKDHAKINVKDELGGKSEVLLDLGRLTESVAGFVFVPMTTYNYGTVKKSVAVFEKGRLIRLADAAASDERGYAPSYGYKTVSVKNVRIGIAVGKDLVDPTCLNCLSLSDCDVIINLSGDFYDFSVDTLAVALSYIYGVTIVSATNDRCAIASMGKALLSTTEPEKRVSVTVKRIYREVTIKKRGGTS